MQFLIQDNGVTCIKFPSHEKRHGCLAELRKLVPKRNLTPLDIPDPVTPRAEKKVEKPDSKQGTLL